MNIKVRVSKVQVDELGKNLLDEGKITCYSIHYAGTAYLDCHNGAVEQNRLVHLSDGCGTQSMFVKACKKLARGLAKILPNLGVYILNIHRCHFRAELNKGIAIFGRNELGLL